MAVLVVANIAPQIPNARIAQANDGGYPWANAADVYPDEYEWGYASCPSDAPYCMTKTREKDGVTYGMYDARNFYFRNCTSYMAWKVSATVNTSGWGNGTSWDTKAAAAGYSVDTTPEIGDIAQWDTVAGGFGHVAYVLEIGAGANAGKVRVAEYNWSVLGGFSDTRWATADHYIHIGDAPEERPTDTSTIPWYFETMEGDSGSVSGHNANTGRTPATVVFNGKLYVFSYDESNGNLRMAKSSTGYSGWAFATLDGATSQTRKSAKS